MNTISEYKCNLFGLDKFAKKLAKHNKVGDIYLLKGELGVGKTTFSRFFINSLFDKIDQLKPEKIKSPSFPILISYPIANYEINHFDLFRLINKDELIEIDFFESLRNNVSIIEWPEIIIDNFNLFSYYLIEFKLINNDERIIKLTHSKFIKL